MILAPQRAGENMAFKNPALIDFQSESLVVGANAAARRLVSSLVVTAAPTAATDGVECRRFTQLRFTFDTTVAGTADYSIYWFSAAAQLWTLDLTIGTAGVATVTFAAGNYQPILLTGDADRVYVRINTVAGANARANAWAEGNQ